jgi:hypothetical protein
MESVVERTMLLSAHERPLPLYRVLTSNSFAVSTFFFNSA